MFHDDLFLAIPSFLPNTSRVKQVGAAQNEHYLCVDCMSIFHKGFAALFFLIVKLPEDVINKSKCFD